MSFLSKLKDKVFGKANKEEYLTGFKKTSDNFNEPESRNHEWYSVIGNQ